MFVRSFDVLLSFMCRKCICPTERYNIWIFLNVNTVENIICVQSILNNRRVEIATPTRQFSNWLEKRWRRRRRWSSPTPALPPLPAFPGPPAKNVEVIEKLVHGPENRVHLWLLKHILAQQVIVLGAGLGKFTLTERQVAICIQAANDPESGGG